MKRAPSGFKWKWKSSWQSCCCSQFLAFSCRTENSDTWEREWMQICGLTWKWFFPASSQMHCFYGLFVPNQHMRSVCAIKGDMPDENLIIFIFVRVTKLNTCMSNAFGAGFLPLFAPFSPVFHKSLISIPDKVLCSYLLSCHQMSCQGSSWWIWWSATLFL